MAAEETEKATVYAADDRQAAREELDKLHAAYSAVVDGAETPHDVADAVSRRVGQRTRELDQAVRAMEEMAMNHD